MMVDDLRDTEILSRIKTTLQKLIDGVSLESVTSESRLEEDLGIHSIELVDFVIDLEGEFGILVEDDSIEGIKTIGDAIRLIKDRLG